METREGHGEWPAGIRPGGQPRGGGAGAHHVALRAREEAEVTGVLHVASFDDHEIVLDTDLGTLTLLGHDLQIKQLDLAEGSFRVQGLIDSLSYTASRTSRSGARAPQGGLLGRLFR